MTDDGHKVFRGGTIAAVLCAALLATSRLSADEGKPDEYRVKAALVFNVMKFVDWPSDKPGKPDAGLAVCTLGKSPLEKALGSIAGKVIGGRTVAVRAIASAADSGTCHLLYVGASEKDRLAAITDNASKNHALTISDSAGFAKSGVALNFYLENEKVRFEVNLDAARRAGLTLSSKLLKLARIVETEKDGGR